MRIFFKKHIIGMGFFAAVILSAFLLGAALGFQNPAGSPSGGAGGIRRGTSTVAAGIGLTGSDEPANTLTVAGNAAIGTNFSGNAAPADGLIVEGHVGIGTNNPITKLSVAGGGIALGTTPQRFRQMGRIPYANVITAIGLAMSGSPDYQTSLTVGLDTLPIIAYWRGTDLMTVKCAKLDCSGSTGNVERTIDVNGGGTHASITIGSDGRPVIAYRGLAGGLKIAKCASVDCSIMSSIIQVSSTGSKFASIAVGSDGNPVVAYWDTSADELKFLKCGDLGCASGNSITPVDSGAQAGLGASLAIGNDGLPVISYYKGTSPKLHVVKCSDAACVGTKTITNVDTMSIGAGKTSIAIGNDNLPIVAYTKSGGELLALKCGTPDCTVSNVPAQIALNAALGEITVGTYGFPLISYYDSSGAGALKVAKCGAFDCGSNTTIITVESGAVGRFSSVAIGTDGLPIISYFDSVQEKLKTVKCGSEQCVPYWTRR